MDEEDRCIWQLECASLPQAAGNHQKERKVHFPRRVSFKVRHCKSWFENQREPAE